MSALPPSAARCRTRLRCLAGIAIAGIAGLSLAQSPDVAAPDVARPDVAALYAQHCASCHGENRIGAMAPALLPESLARLKKSDAKKTLREGRAATQMAGFADRLSDAQIDALVDSLYGAAGAGSAVPPKITFSEAQILASRVAPAHELPAQPLPLFAGRDLMNLFVVVEAGDHHVSLIDGDTLEVIHRFASRYALHGGPKFSPDGRFVYFASRDGWVSKYDIWNLTLVAEIRVGINTRNIAVSGDGRQVIAANYLPQNLVLLDADLALQKVLPARSMDGQRTSRVSAVYDASPRKSFVAAMKDMPELWEISWDPQAAPIHNGLVHDYALNEALVTPGYLNVRRTVLDEVLDDFYFDPTYAYVMGASRGGKAQVVNLDVRRKIADLDLAGMPHLGAGISFDWQGRRVMVSPNLRDGALTVIDMRTWQTVRRIATHGAGFFLRGHEQSPWIWADAMLGSARNVMEIFDKRSLEKAGEVRIDDGLTLAHVEFDRYGKYALASVMERRAAGGAIIVYDAQTWREIKRLPMDKPVGKYNLFNKLKRSEGTSH